MAKKQTKTKPIKPKQSKTKTGALLGGIGFGGVMGSNRKTKRNGVHLSNNIR